LGLDGFKKVKDVRCHFIIKTLVRILYNYHIKKL
jgi:hypothetical protein